MRDLEAAGRLDRALEALPDAETVAERRTAGLGLTQPELAVVLAYSKITLYAALLESDLPEDPALDDELARYFPAPLPERFGDEMRAPPAAARDHRHARDQRPGRPRGDDVRVPPARGHRRVARGHRARVAGRARRVRRALAVGGRSRRSTARSRRDVQNEMLLVEPADGRARDALAAAHAAAAAGHRGRDRALRATARAVVAGALPGVLVESEQEAWRERVGAADRGRACPEALAGRVAAQGALFSALDIVEVADATGARRSSEVAALHFLLGGKLHLHWLRDRIALLPRDNRWAGDGARGAARRPLQPARGADRRRAALRRARRVDRGQPRGGRARAGDPRRDPRGRDVRPHDAAGRAARGAQPHPAALPRPRGVKLLQTVEAKRARVGPVVELDPGHPLDPDEAALAGGDEPDGRAVAVAERLAADVGGEQQLARVGAVEAPAVAGVRDHADVAAGRVAEQAVEADAAPVAASSRSRRCSRAWRSASSPASSSSSVSVAVADVQPVVGAVERARVVGDPGRRRERVALERRDLVGAGEAPLRARQPGRALQLPGERARPTPTPA